MEATPESEGGQPPPRKKAHKGHAAHGGAWKVAYADFVTAMLALFIVLWILSQDEPTKEAIQGYFKDPIGYTESMGAARMSLVSGQNPPPTAAEVMTKLEQSLSQETMRMRESVQKSVDLSEMSDQVEIEMTEEGIRIELRDNAKFNFFEVGSANPTAQLRMLLKLLTPEIQRLGYPVAIEGHTDGRVYENPNYSNWELSSDRANSTRRILIASGLSPSMVCEIDAFADKHLRLPNDPQSPENRRISILLKTPLIELRPQAARQSPVRLK